MLCQIILSQHIGYSYSEGLNSNLSGIQALWFARERHAFAEGDKQRDVIR